MPTYDYECQRCDHVFEHFQNISEPNLKRCPKCRGKLKRLIGKGSGIIFKGSGFYETDYRKSEYKEKAKMEKDASKEATKTDTSTKKDDKKKSDSDTSSAK